MARIRSLYGDTPLHALAHLGSFALAGFAILQLTDVRPHLYVIGWFVGAVILHDLVLLPAYSALDRLGVRTLRGGINYVRVPLVLSGLLLLSFFPVMFSDSAEANYNRVSSLGYEGYLGRWLLVSGLLFAGAAILYAVRGRAQRSAGSTS